MDSEHLLYLLYTSGTTGKPKGIMHTTGGYLTQVAFTHKYVFDLHPDDRRLLVHGRHRLGHRPQLHRLRPARQRRHVGDVRGHARLPRQRPLLGDRREVRRHDLLHRADRDPHVHEVGRPRSRPSTTCRRCALLGSVGEPINPEAWMWYHEHIGGGRCPIVDTWWQTETGGDHDQPAARRHHHQAGLGHVPAARHRRRGRRRRTASRSTRGGGYLTLTRPWPAMLRGIWGDPERYRETYWSRFPGRYFAGDGAKLDDDGYLWLLGRVDDVMNVSRPPHLDHRGRVGAGRPPDGRRGRRRRRQRRHHRPGDHRLRHRCAAATERRRSARSCASTSATKIGADRQAEDDLSSPPDLPKTRSGKIMRRLLRDVAEGRDLGDTTTLADAGVVDEIQRRAAEAPPED